MPVSGKITFIPEKLTKDMIRAIKRHTKKTAQLNEKMVKDSISNGKDIVSGGNFAHLKETSKDVRSQRGISGSKPLVATGKLLSSIKTVADGDGYSVVMGSDYGIYHNEGFIVGSGWFKAGKKWYNFEGREVPRRRFFDTPRAFFRRGEYRALLRELDDEIKKELKKLPVKRI